MSKVLVHFDIIKRLKLTPENFSSSDMKKISKIYLKKNHPVLHMEFHSQNIMPGFVNYVKNNKDLEKFYRKLKDVFDFLINEQEIVSVTCSEFKKILKYNSSLSYK